SVVMAMNTSTLALDRSRLSLTPLGAGVVLVLGAWLLSGFVPIAFSIAIVFLFAGPHNWIEARYFLGRLPARWGKLRGFFLLGFTGVFGLTAAFAALPWLSRAWAWGDDGRFLAYATWNSLVIAWVVTLALMRSQ